MARFIDYQPTEKEGLFRFRDEQGGERLLFGTAAASIKDTIDRDKQTAARAVGEGSMSAEEWNGLSLYNQQAKAPEQGEDKRTAFFTPPAAQGTMPVARRDAPQTSAEATRPEPKQPTTSPLPDVPVANPEMGAKPGGEGQAAPGNVQILDTFQGKGGVMYQVVRAPNGEEFYQAVEPARAGSAAKPGKMVPHMTTRTQLREPDEGYYELREDVTGDLQEATGEQARAVEQVAESAADTMQRQNRDMFNAQMQEIYRQRAMEAAHQQAGAALQDYTAKLNSFEIDPNRIYSGEGGKDREFRHRIASVFGAFGSTLAKSPNFVAERIRAMREDDIRAQEQELLKLQGSRDNALRHFQTISGDLETAKHAVRKLQNDRYIVQLKREAALAQTPQAKAAALKTVAELERENLDFEQKFKQETAGQITKSFRYQPGSPGSPGRPATTRLVSPEEAKSIAGARKAMGQVGPGGEKKPREAVGTLVGYETGLAEIMGRLEQRFAKDPGLRTRPMSEHLYGKFARFLPNLLKEGSGYRMPRIFGGLPQEELDQLQDFKAATYQVGTMINQAIGAGAITGNEGDEIKAAIATAKSYDELIRFIDGARKTVRARIKGMEDYYEGTAPEPKYAEGVEFSDDEGGFQ